MVQLIADSLCRFPTWPEDGSDHRGGMVKWIKWSVIIACFHSWAKNFLLSVAMSSANLCLSPPPEKWIICNPTMIPIHSTKLCIFLQAAIHRKVLACNGQQPCQCPKRDKICTHSSGNKTREHQREISLGLVHCLNCFHVLVSGNWNVVRAYKVNEIRGMISAENIGEFTFEPSKTPLSKFSVGFFNLSFQISIRFSMRYTKAPRRWRVSWRKASCSKSSSATAGLRGLISDSSLLSWLLNLAMLSLFIHAIRG